MTAKQFRCTFLTDVILSQHSRTEGNQDTLDFIPGNNFLGIVARELYKDDKLTPQQQLAIFHSHQVRFSDAHPLVNNKRTFRIPLDLFKPKDENITKLYIHHETQINDELRKLQLKQCREGFYYQDGESLQECRINKNVAVKSAYDTNMRRAKDEQMFSYQSIEQGTQFAFFIESENDELLCKVTDALIGIRYLGRSHTAQYGRILIEEQAFTEETSHTSKNNMVVVYADSRLIFFDEYGQPTCQPSAEDLGLPNGAVHWGKSQIRTFQYAPWNGKRQAYDTDRCGIEKGSVIIVEYPDGNIPATFENKYVGEYQNEGFGHVIYNPAFLQTKPSAQNGESAFALRKYIIPNDREYTGYINLDKEDKELMSNLRYRQKSAQTDARIYKEVNEFVANNCRYYAKDSFKSQWGQIRQLAMRYSDAKQLADEIIKYISHGISEKLWIGKPQEVLLKAMKQESISDLQKFIINLASEMQKEH